MLLKKIHLLYLVNFLAAFLLFQIELIISKVFLPKFGGTYLIWGACVVFFQSVLLLGYLYSHVVVQKIGLFKYSYLHLVLIALPLLFFPGRPLPVIIANNHLPIVIDIFLQLFISIGAVFFVLSTISIITQSWLSFSDLPQHANPFILYGVSNAGSFLALISYPFIFELIYNLNQQLAIWRATYLIFLLFYFLAFYLIKVNGQAAVRVPIFNITSVFKQFGHAGTARQGIFWFLLSAAGSILFLSVTNIITYEITPCPLLWIMPLCIYLISFVLNFKEKPFCPGWIKNKINLHVGFGILLFFLTQMSMFPLLIEIAAYGVSLFILCMYCQYKLFTTRPKEKERLTSFYLIISFGGVIGSIGVTWLAPLIFVNTLEFLFGLFMVTLALVINEERPEIKLFQLRYIIYTALIPVLWYLVSPQYLFGIFMAIMVLVINEKKPEIESFQLRLIIYTALILVLWPLVFGHYNLFGIIMIAILFKYIFSELRTAKILNICSLCVFIIASFSLNNWMHDGKNVYSERNYYGIYRLNVSENMLVFLNGTTLHGQQYLDKKKANEPLAYFHHDTPVGKFLDSNLFQVKNMGVTGLGTGTLAAYGKEGQEIDFFELDRDVFEIANSFFSYLKDSHAKINYIFGDARITLAKMPENKYDLLILDAFSGDSLPVHLVTVEAIREYKKHLKREGVILANVSNRYLNLVPVLFNNAKAVNAYAAVNSNEKGKSRAYLSSIWVALTWDANSKDKLIQKLEWKEEGDNLRVKKIRPWTDIYSNIFSVLEVGGFITPMNRADYVEGTHDNPEKFFEAK